MSFGSILKGISVYIGDKLDMDIPIGITAFGGIYTDSLEFLAGEFKSPTGQILKYKGLELPYITFSVSSDKNIVAKNIQGKIGTIKQYISSSDYTINANCNLVGYSPAPLRLGDFPTADLINLNILEQVPNKLKIKCKILNDYYRINYVVINRINKNHDNKGNVISFDMELTSDSLEYNFKDFLK